MKINLFIFIDVYSMETYCWLVRVRLFIELGGAQDLGTGWWGALGTFMISRSI